MIYRNQIQFILLNNFIGLKEYDASLEVSI